MAWLLMATPWCAEATCLRADGCPDNLSEVSSRSCLPSRGRGRSRSPLDICRGPTRAAAHKPFLDPWGGRGPGKKSPGASPCLGECEGNWRSQDRRIEEIHGVWPSMSHQRCSFRPCPRTASAADG